MPIPLPAKAPHTDILPFTKAARHTSKHNYPIIEHLQKKLRQALADCLPVGTDYAILDFPNYANIGDSAIYVGETILCRQHFGRKPLLVTTNKEWDIDVVAKLDPAVPLLLQGGGNLGDLYPRHQIFREKILARFPDRRIVLLPQSIHFETNEALQRAAAAFNSHPNFTLMVRDRTSLAIAQRHFTCPTMLVPDMAFMIGAIKPPQPADLKVLSLIREDQESILPETLALDHLPQPSAVVDWPREQRSRRRPLNRLPHSVRRFLPAPLQGDEPISPAAFERVARARLNRGLRILSRGEMVLTDRLHAHILSILLGKPHIALDNSYRKIGNFSDAWTRGAAFASAPSLDEAVHMLKASAA